MSTPPSKITPVESSQPKQPQYTYTGLNDSGRIRLTRDGKTLLINGAVYASTAPPAGNTKIVLVPLNATPGYKREPNHKKYLARTATGETFRVIGAIEQILMPAAPIEKKSIRTLVDNATAPENQKSLRASTTQLTTPVAVPPPPQTKLTPAHLLDTKKHAKLARLEKEFQRVIAQRASGIDPAVRMAFVAHYLGESESNLYRKKAEGQFPYSIQRGKGTFWLLSDLDAFKKGAWKPTG